MIGQKQQQNLEYKAIFSLLQAQKFSEADRYLLNLNTSCLTDLEIICILRLTYSYRVQLTMWDYLFSLAEQTLTCRGYDGTKVLANLYNIGATL